MKEWICLDQMNVSERVQNAEKFAVSKEADIR